MVQSIGNSSHGGHHAEVRQRRPDTTRLVDNVFTKLDTKNQGFLEKADLQAALSRIPGAAGNATTDDAVFQRLDSDADGKVTKAELTSTLQTAADQLAGQFDGLRLHGRHGHHGHGHGRGRGHDGEDATAGFTKDQLSAQLEGLGGSHGGRARMLGAVIDNFAQADANADGQVNFREIVGFFRGDGDAAPVTTPAAVEPTPAIDPVTSAAATAPPATPVLTSTASTDATPATPGATPPADLAAAERAVLQRILQLVRAYGAPGDTPGDASISASA